MGGAQNRTPWPASTRGARPSRHDGGVARPWCPAAWLPGPGLLRPSERGKHLSGTRQARRSPCPGRASPPTHTPTHRQVLKPKVVQRLVLGLVHAVCKLRGHAMEILEQGAEQHLLPPRFEQRQLRRGGRGWAGLTLGVPTPALPPRPPAASMRTHQNRVQVTHSAWTAAVRCEDRRAGAWPRCTCLAWAALEPRTSTVNSSLIRRQRSCAHSCTDLKSISDRPNMPCQCSGGAAPL